MNMRRLARILSVLLLTSLFQVPVLLGDEGVYRERDLTQVRKKVEALRAWQLTEELDLDEETSSRLFPAMRKADKERWKIEASNRKLVREMSQSLQAKKPDSRRINRILNELQENRRELIRVEENHLERVRQVLSPADTARYLLFQIRFQKEIKLKAAEALRDRRQLNDSLDYKAGDRYRNKDSGGDAGGGSGDSSGGSDRRRR